MNNGSIRAKIRSITTAVAGLLLFKFTHRLYGVYLGMVGESFSQRNFPYDDAVTLGIQLLSKYLLISFSLWLISFIFLMFHWIWSFSVPWTILYFIPMWIGSVIAFISVILTIKSIYFSCKLITRQEREYLLVEHREINGQRLIDYDSLLLLRYLSFYGFVICFSIILIFTSQILVARWLAYGNIQLWSALSPIIILSILIISCLFLIKSVSLTTSILSALFFLQMILFISKMNSQLSLPWSWIILPGLLVQITLLFQVIYILYLHFRRRCILPVIQQLILFSHMISLAFPFYPEFLTFRAELGVLYSVESIFDDNTWHELQIWYLLVIVLFLVTMMCVFYREAGFIAQTRGFTSPLPISKTSRGWIPLTRRRIFFPLLGTISILNYSVDGGNPQILNYWLDPCYIFFEFNLCWKTCTESSHSYEYLPNARNTMDSSSRGYGSIDREGVQSPISSSNRLSTSSRKSLRQSIETYELLPRKRSGELENGDDDFEIV